MKPSPQFITRIAFLFIFIFLLFFLGNRSFALGTKTPTSSKQTSTKSVTPTMPVIPPKEKSASSSSQRSACIPTDEVCDGLDNDCDGLADDYACLTPGKFIAKFKDVPNLSSPAALGSTGLSSVDVLNQQHGVTNLQRVFPTTGKTGGEHSLSRIYEFTVPVTSDIPAIAAEYQANEYIEYAEPIDYGVQLQSFPNDPYYWSIGSWCCPDPYPDTADQYWIHLVEASNAWSDADGTGVTVAYTDFIKGDHPDLAGQLWINQNEIPGNAIDDDGNGYMDDYYGPCGSAWCHYSDPAYPYVNNHGTGMAGIIAAKTNNNYGMAGMASGSKLMALGEPWALRMKYAVDNGAKILVHSWSGRGNAWEDLLEHAYNAGVLTFVAAGNSRGYSTTLGTLPTAINVGNVYWDSVQGQDFRHFGSGWGETLDIMAPGWAILSTSYDEGELGDGFTPQTGTSFSAPVAGGLAALLLSYNQALTPGQLRYIILNSTDEKGDPGWDILYGHGRINVRKAFDIVRSGNPIPEWNYTSKITYPRWAQRTNDGTVEVKGTASSPNFVSYQLDLCEPSRSDVNGWDPEDNASLHNCQQVASSTTPVLDGVLGSFDLDAYGVVGNSWYLLRLTVNDSVIPHYKPYITFFSSPVRTREVPADYPTIQAAVTAAFDGDTILVSAGTYTMTKDWDIWVEKKKITFKSIAGPTETIIDCNGHDGILFYSDNGTFQGFTIKNTPTNGTINLALTGYKITVRNNIFVSGGVGIIVNVSQHTNIINNTFYRPIQQAISVWGSGNLIAKNNILVGSGIGDGIWMPGGNSTLTYNNVLNFAQNYSPTLTPGPGSLSIDPLFVDPANGDYHLQNFVSPCIDTGDSRDSFFYEPVPNGFRINMGAYGNTPEAELSSVSASYVCGDANGDNAVDISDAVYLIQYIFADGPAPQPYPAGDANGDNTVDISDAVYLIQYIFAGGPAPICPMSKKIVQPSQDPAGGYTLDSFKEAYPQVFSAEEQIQSPAL